MSDEEYTSLEGSPAPEEEDEHEEQYVRFDVNALRHVTKDADEAHKFIEVGSRYNMCFKMLKSDSRLVKSVLFGYGFIQCSHKNANYNMFWTNVHLTANGWRQLKSWQRINHFPRSYLITKKDDLYDNVYRAAIQYGSMFNFIPESYSPPFTDEKREKIKSELNAGKCSFILKPTNSSRGRGIGFIQKPEDIDQIPNMEKVILSRYISNPLLIENKKSDMRVYVCVTSYYPLTAYMFTDGLNRFAVEEYNNDVAGNSSEAQLTNYSLHKLSDKFIQNTKTDSESHGHKWTLSAMLRHLKKQGADTDLLMVRIEDVVIKTLLSIQRVVAANIRKLNIGPKTCFELFGFDILVDDDLKPWLLEVNLSPSLACDAPLDSIIKTHLICDTLNLACIPLVLRNNRSVSALMGTINNPQVDDLSRAVSMASMGSTPASGASPSTVDSGYDSHSVDAAAQKIKELKPQSRKRVVRGTSVRGGKLKRAQISPPKTSFNVANKDGAYAERLNLLEDKLREEESRTGDFVRIFPRPESMHLYGLIVEDSGVEDWDHQLHQRIYGEQPAIPHCESLLCHEELIDAKKFPTTASLSKSTRQLLKTAYKTAAEYRKPFYEHVDNPFPAALPKLRPTARRRTQSQLDFDIRRRVEVLEQREKLAEKENAAKAAGDASAQPLGDEVPLLV